MSIIIISAAKFEADPLVNALQQVGRHPEHKIAGVGSINAAKSSRQLAEACRGHDVIFVGTCGSFGPFKEIKLVRPSKVCWLPTAVRTQMAYTISNSAPAVEVPDPLPWALSLPSRDVVCAPAVSMIKTLPDDWNPKNCVENIELYSVIGDLINAAVTVTVVLAVTNGIGQDAHTEWKQNHAIAAGKTAEFIRKNLIGSKWS